jgi:hypothetical protein
MAYFKIIREEEDKAIERIKNAPKGVSAFKPMYD